MFATAILAAQATPEALPKSWHMKASERRTRQPRL
jgi:hypothetical protein